MNDLRKILKEKGYVPKTDTSLVVFENKTFDFSEESINGFLADIQLWLIKDKKIQVFVSPTTMEIDKETYLAWSCSKQYLHRVINYHFHPEWLVVNENSYSDALVKGLTKAVNDL